MKKILFIILIVAVAIISALWVENGRLRKDRDTYKANQTALMDKVTYYQSESGKYAASVQRLELSYSELKENYELVRATAEDLGLKLRRIQSTSTQVTESKVQVVTQIRDSVVVREGRIDSLLRFDWADPWTSVIGEIEGRKIALGIASTDTLVQIVHRVPHKFWFIKWGTKAIRQEIVSTNPHTHITYSEYIELRK